LNQQHHIQPEQLETRPESPLQRFSEACAQVDRHSAGELLSLYAEDIYYEDSTHALQGKNAFLSYCTDVLGERSASIRIITSIEDENSFFISWAATLKVGSAKGDKQRVEGASYCKVRNGLIYFQRNYFDLIKQGRKRDSLNGLSWLKARKTP